MVSLCRFDTLIMYNSEMIKKKKINFDKISLKLTESIGTPTSIIIHAVFFIVVFATLLFGWSLNRMLLFLTTVLSIEAIYLALFIQMTVNKTTENLEDVEEDIEVIQKSDKLDDKQDELIIKTLKNINDRINEIKKELESRHSSKI